MLRRFHGALCAFVLMAAAGSAAFPARADDSAPPTPATMSAAEKHFVDEARAALEQRYATTAAAEKAGYVRYTNEDDTGVISYAAKDWNSTSPATPSQLWYTAHGKLVGADYSVSADNRTTPPSLFGIAPSRFTVFGAHIHYVLKNADGTYTYSRAIGAKKYKAAGLDPAHPTAAGLVKAGAVTSASQVATVFLFPHIYDVGVWIVPNPNGAFAEKNPNVKPVHPMGEM